MALAPGSAPWYRRFRMLLGIYLIAAAFGVREYVVSRNLPPVDPNTEEWSRMAEVVSEINPADADTEYLAAMEALREGDSERFVEHMERALVTQNAKHNEILLQAYAQHLFSTGADYRRVNDWLNRWRTNHPSSAEVFEIPLGSGPRDPADESALRREVGAVDWILGHEFRSPEQSGAGWRVLVTFRPAVEIDVREAVAAVSILAIPPDQRASFRVNCLSLENCQRVPR